LLSNAGDLKSNPASLFVLTGPQGARLLSSALDVMAVAFQRQKPATGGIMIRTRSKNLILLAFFFVLLIAGSALAYAQTDGPILVAKFSGNLNTKSAKIGDPISAKTEGKSKLMDGTEVPKGSTLIGKVIVVQSKNDGKGFSTFALRFDQIELKGGGTHPVYGQIVAIGPAADSQTGLGYDSVVGRGGPGSTSGLDPHDGAGVQVDRDDDKLPFGTTLDGVGIGRRIGAEGASILRGIHKDILLDSSVAIKFRLG
jgi:hypothetical protein